MTIRHGRHIGRPADDLTDKDFDILDHGTFGEFKAWDAKRTAGGPYHLGEFSIAEVFDWMRWLKCYAIRLEKRLDESHSARHIHELEAELARVVLSLRRAEDGTDVRKLRRDLENARAENVNLRRELIPQWKNEK